MNESTRHPDMPQEEDVVPKWGILSVLAALVAIFCILIAWAWYATRLEEAVVRPSGQYPEEHLGPRRDIDEVNERLFEEKGAGQALRMRQREDLERFQWVDRGQGVVSIPIGDAMDLVVQEGTK